MSIFSQVEVPSSLDSSSFTPMFHLRLFSQVPFSFTFITDSFLVITIIYYIHDCSCHRNSKSFWGLVLSLFLVSCGLLPLSIWWTGIFSTFKVCNSSFIFCAIEIAYVHKYISALDSNCFWAPSSQSLHTNLPQQTSFKKALQSHGAANLHNSAIYSTKVSSVAWY